MDWREYEDKIFELLKNRYSANAIEADAKIEGRFSKVLRQIDVAGHTDLVGQPMLAIVDCKCYSKAVDVKDVEAVIGMAADVRADIALIVTTVGYSEAALARAQNEPNVRLHLDIVTPEEASELGEVPAFAFMYRGRIGAAVLAPSGWLATSNVTDAGRLLPFNATCYFHPVGLSVQEAMKRRWIGWCEIAENINGEPDFLKNIIKIQEAGAIEFDQDSEIEMWQEVLGDNEIPKLFRRINYPNARHVDFTVLIDLDNAGVFWISMISELGDEKETLNWVRFVAEKARLAYAPNADPENSDGFWQNYFPWRKKEKSGEMPPDDSGSVGQG